MKRYLLKIFRKINKPFLCRSLGKLKLVRFVYGFLISFLSPIEINGYKIFVDPTDSLELFINPNYSYFEKEIFTKNVKKGDVVLDLGSHIGYYTLIAAKLVGREGKIFAFEPGQVEFNLLSKNIRINGYQNTVLINKAVSNETGKNKLFLHGDRADNRIYNSHDNRKYIEIETVKLDDYFQNYNGKIDFVKMNIQGSEGLALMGMHEILQKKSSLKIMTAFHPDLIKKSGINPIDCLNLLIGHGFKLYNINTEKKELEPIKNIQEICGKIRNFLFCIK